MDFFYKHALALVLAVQHGTNIRLLTSYCLDIFQVINAAVENLNEDLDYDPQVVILCDKVTRHVDVNTGDWIVDKNSSRLCTTDRKEILK